MQISKLLVAGTLFLGLTLPVLAAPGNPTNLPNHPRVNQVNKRVQNQHSRIKKNEKKGLMTQKQAAKLGHQRKQVKTEERDMRSQDKGHLTKTDHKALNQQLNKRSHEIKHDRKVDK